MTIPTTLKACSSCKQELPLSEENFRFRHKSYPDLGHHSICRKCDGEARKNRRRDVYKQAFSALQVEAQAAPGKELPLQIHWAPPLTPTMELPARGTTVAIGDLHFPFHHASALQMALELVRILQPDNVVQVGDLNDQQSFTRHPGTRNIMTPRDEIQEARRYGEWFWAQVRSISPSSKCYQLHGNHDDRGLKRVLETVPAAEDWAIRSTKELLTFPGVELVWRDELVLDDVWYTHGCYSFGEHVKRMNKSVVTGHLHRGGVAYLQQHNGPTLFELNCGWLGNSDLPAFSYTALRRIHGWTLGAGVVDQYGPRFCSFQ